MCDGLRDLRQALEGFSGRFDADLITAAAATVVMEDAAAMENMAAAIKAAAAARVASTGLWRRRGDRSPAHALARKTGSTVGQAAEALATARRLRALPATAAATRKGQLSPSQAAAIADAASTDPASEATLLDKAEESSLAELREEAAKAKAAALPDAEARRRRIHARRYIRERTDLEGGWHLHMFDNPEIGAEVMAALGPVRDRLAARARAAGRHEPLEAHAADALAEMVRSYGEAATSGEGTGRATGGEEGAGPEAATSGGEGAGGGSASEGDNDTGGQDTGPDGHHDPDADARSGGEGMQPVPAGSPAGAPEHRGGPARPPSPARAKIIVRVDLDALLRGYAVGGETVELVGYGPVAVSVVRDMIDSGDPFLAAVATRGVDVVGVAHLGRRPNAHQQTALEWLCPTCTVQGCSARWHLEVDHRIDWADTHFTLLDLLDRLCGHHHRLKTREGWALVQGVGKRPMVPPDDPRHPRHAHRERPPPVVV